MPRIIKPAKLTTVVNLYKEPFDVYIGRGKCPVEREGVEPYSIWGNPFVIGGEYDGMVIDRELACDLHEEWLLYSDKEGVEILRSRIKELVGKRLGCYCSKNQRCHGDILAKLANDYANKHNR